MKTGAELIAEERKRQVTQERWTDWHDDQHDEGELAKAAVSYAFQAVLKVYSENPPPPWPWESEWWKPSPDPVRNLVKAGALIAAEIDRLQRREANKLPDAC